MKKNIILLKLVVIIALPITLLILPANFFDGKQSLCISQLLLHTSCYGCGITRAIQHLIHAEFETAAAFNKLSFIVLPLLIIVWIKEIRLTFKQWRQLTKIT